MISDIESIWFGVASAHGDMVLNFVFQSILEQLTAHVFEFHIKPSQEYSDLLGQAWLPLYSCRLLGLWRNQLALHLRTC